MMLHVPGNDIPQSIEYLKRDDALQWIKAHVQVWWLTHQQLWRAQMRGVRRGTKGIGYTEDEAILELFKDGGIDKWRSEDESVGKVESAKGGI